MLKKCLKYDLIAVARVWWIAAATVMLLSVPVGFCLRDAVIHSEDVNRFPWSGFGIMLGYLSAVAFVIVTAILVFIRYYGNFFRDEGYLTFTLPVKRQTLFWSKVINGMIWMIASALVIGAALCIVLAMAPAEPDSEITALTAFLRGTGEFFAEGYEALGGWLIAYSAELLLLTLLGTLSTVLAVYLCITIGAVLVRKHKLLASIGILYGFNILSSILSYAAIIFLAFWIVSANSAFPDAQIGTLGVFLILLLTCVIAAVVNTVMAFVNLGCLERKLNLS